MEKTWWKEAVIYQIYPRSYMDSNEDGIGDLQGIIGKLDYLKWLGVDVLWLSPIYCSPNADNGYDISNYQGIMEEFGTMEDFDALLKEAHRRGLKIMLDLVVNHSSDEHPWFLESKSSCDNKYRDYYIWKEGKNGTPPNRWEAFFGGSAWEYSAETGMYYLHLFSPKQPDLNWKNPALREEIYRMMTWWLDKGIDGFRMDVINYIAKADGFPEGIPIPGTPYTEKEPYICCVPQFHDYLQEMNKRVLSHYDIMTVGETPGITVEDGSLVTDPSRHELQMVFQFEHVDVENEGDKWSNKRFQLVKLKDIFSKWQYGLEEKGWNSLYWNNHDQPRVVSRFGNDGVYWEKSAKMLGLCLHMMKGTPYIYQGEEIGMVNADYTSIDQYQDVETHSAYERYVNMLGMKPEEMMQRIKMRSRDNARTPMQWNATKHGGFTNGTPWIQENGSYHKINVEKQKNDPDSILNFYRTLIALRKQYSIIVYGRFEMLESNHPKLFAYTRKLDGKMLLVTCNFSEEVVEMKMPEELQRQKGTVLLSNYANKLLEDMLTLKPYEGTVYLFEER